MTSGDALKAYGREYDERGDRLRAKRAAKRDLVGDTDLTAEELAEVQPRLKADTMQRRPEWFA